MTIEQKAEKYFQNLSLPLADTKNLVITAYCIGAEEAKRGGKRKGAGRPVTKEPTVVKRIPISKLDAVLKAIGKA